MMRHKKPKSNQHRPGILLFLWASPHYVLSFSYSVAGYSSICSHPAKNYPKPTNDHYHDKCLTSVHEILQGNLSNRSKHLQVPVLSHIQYHLKHLPKKSHWVFNSFNLKESNLQFTWWRSHPAHSSPGDMAIYHPHRTETLPWLANITVTSINEQPLSFPPFQRSNRSTFYAVK